MVNVGFELQVKIKNQSDVVAGNTITFETVDTHTVEYMP